MTKLEDKCYEIYRRKGITGGATSVIDYINKHRPDVPWYPCLPCDATQPFDPDTKSCLVCGSAKGFLQEEDMNAVDALIAIRSRAWDLEDMLPDEMVTEISLIIDIITIADEAIDDYIGPEEE